MATHFKCLETLIMKAISGLPEAWMLDFDVTYRFSQILSNNIGLRH